MSHHMPEHDPRSQFEDEGIPDLQDGTPEQQWAVDPQQAPVPGDEPMAADDYGTTVEEQIEGESLDGRLAREVPDVGVAESAGEAGAAGADRRPRRQREASGSDREPDAEEAETSGESPEAGPVPPDVPAGEPEGALTADSGLGVGSDISTDYEPGPGVDPEWPAQPEEPSGEVWEPPRPAGRLVAPDEGVRSDAEPDEIAQEAGPDTGGFSAEEAAMRVEPEE